MYVPQLLYPFIYQWTSRLLPCSSIVNSAAMNNGIHVSFSILISSGYMPRSGIAGSYGGFIPIFLRNLHHNVLVFMYQQSYYLSSTILKLKSLIIKAMYIFC